MSAIIEIQKNSLEKTASASVIFKLLADPTRLKILCLLYKNKNGLCVYEIAESVSISQSAASHQLAKLEANGIVESFREGQTVCYCIKKGESSNNIEKVMKVFNI